MNTVILMGNLTRDPEIKQGQSGTVIAKFGIAVNDRKPDGNGGYTDKPNFFDVTMFGKQAESLQRFFKKGSKILIEGKLEFDQWQDRETGQNRSKVSVVAMRWHFCNSPGQAQQPSPQDQVGQSVSAGFGAVPTDASVPF